MEEDENENFSDDLDGCEVDDSMDSSRHAKFNNEKQTNKAD